MLEVSARSHFSAAHHLRGYKGKCEADHGHNWEVEVIARGGQADKTGILLDFRQLKDCLREVLSDLDHKDLNKLKAFKKDNPTSEHIARYVFRRMSAKLDRAGSKVCRVNVRETPETMASYWEE